VSKSHRPAGNLRNPNQYWVMRAGYTGSRVQKQLNSVNSGLIWSGPVLKNWVHRYPNPTTVCPRRVILVIFLLCTTLLQETLVYFPIDFSSSNISLLVFFLPNVQYCPSARQRKEAKQVCLENLTLHYIHVVVLFMRWGDNFLIKYIFFSFDKLKGNFDITSIILFTLTPFLLFLFGNRLFQLYYYYYLYLQPLYLLFSFFKLSFSFHGGTWLLRLFLLI
jgi:hypothetical protein